jgi:phosphohistidine phosphatase
VLVYLVRHAHSGPGEPDELRTLSPRGLEEARALGERLGSVPAPPRVVLASPLVRARETAEQIARATGSELRVDERLAPGATADLLLEALEGAEGPVVAVAHQPDCSEITLALTGEDPGFPPGGMAEIAVDG